MKKKFKMLLIIYLFVFLLSVGCFEKKKNIVISNEQKFIGTWENISQYQGNTVISTYTFYENKSYMLDINNKLSFWGSWNITDNKIVTILEGRTQNGTYNFLDNNLKLEITDDTGFTTVLTKKLIY